jgi:hypothetical protein
VCVKFRADHFHICEQWRRTRSHLATVISPLGFCCTHKPICSSSSTRIWFEMRQSCRSSRMPVCFNTRSCNTYHAEGGAGPDQRHVAIDTNSLSGAHVHVRGCLQQLSKPGATQRQRVLCILAGRLPGALAREAPPNCTHLAGRALPSLDTLHDRHQVRLDLEA